MIMLLLRALFLVGTGTLDFTPYLSIKHGKPSHNDAASLILRKPTALNFRKWLGGEEAINTYCHNLAVSGGKRLAEILGTRILDETGEITLNMVTHRPLWCTPGINFHFDRPTSNYPSL